MSMLKIIPFDENHLAAAAELVRERYRHLLEQEPRLPARYTESGAYLPLLQQIVNSGGVAAVRGGKLAGFLAGWKLSSFRGRRSIYSPEWANAADLQDSARIYEAMYAQLAADWMAEKFVSHYISLFPDDAQALKAWHWLGFGMVSVDALCGLDPVAGAEVDADIRRAGLPDLEQVLQLEQALWQYHTGSPIFLLGERKLPGYYQEWLQDPNKVIWLAFLKDEPVALLRLGPADQEVATIIQDGKTTSIYAAFTKEKVRKQGIGTALLNHALQAAKEAGYERCAVSFEPMNTPGKRFWLETFKPVCYSVVNHIDARLTNISSM